MLTRDELGKILRSRLKAPRGSGKSWRKQELVVRTYIETWSADRTCELTGVTRSYVWDTLSRYRCVATYVLKEEK